MSKAEAPTPYTKGAPGRASWWMQRPASTSALPTITDDATEAGAVAPADGAGARITGMPSRAHMRSLSAASGSKLSGGDDMMRQAKLADSPHRPAICAIAVSYTHLR